MGYFLLVIGIILIIIGTIMVIAGIVIFNRDFSDNTVNGIITITPVSPGTWFLIIGGWILALIGAILILVAGNGTTVIHHDSYTSHTDRVIRD